MILAVWREQYKEKIMAFEKVNFDFPHEANKKPQIDIEDSGAIEVDISGKGKEEKKGTGRERTARKGKHVKG